MTCAPTPLLACALALSACGAEAPAPPSPPPASEATAAAEAAEPPAAPTPPAEAAEPPAPPTPPREGLRPLLGGAAADEVAAVASTVRVVLVHEGLLASEERSLARVRAALARDHEVTWVNAPSAEERALAFAQIDQPGDGRASAAWPAWRDQALVVVLRVPPPAETSRGRRVANHLGGVAVLGATRDGVRQPRVRMRMDEGANLHPGDVALPELVSLVRAVAAEGT